MDLDLLIKEVELAIHQYYMGESVVRVRLDGEETEFNRVNIDKLESYLSRLQARKFGKAQYGAIGFVF